MFVEKLTKQDVQEFLGNNHKLNSMFLDKSVCTGQVQLCINTTFGNSDYDYNHRLTDMTGMTSDTLWIRFLYKKFGEEYKQWYINKHLKIFDITQGEDI